MAKKKFIQIIDYKRPTNSALPVSSITQYNKPAQTAPQPTPTIAQPAIQNPAQESPYNASTAYTKFFTNRPSTKTTPAVISNNGRAPFTQADENRMYELQWSLGRPYASKMEFYNDALNEYNDLQSRYKAEQTLRAEDIARYAETKRQLEQYANPYRRQEAKAAGTFNEDEYRAGAGALRETAREQKAALDYVMPSFGQRMAASAGSSLGGYAAAIPTLIEGADESKNNKVLLRHNEDLRDLVTARNALSRQLNKDPGNAELQAQIDEINRQLAEAGMQTATYSDWTNTVRQNINELEGERNIGRIDAERFFADVGRSAAENIAFLPLLAATGGGSAALQAVGSGAQLAAMGARTAGESSYNATQEGAFANEAFDRGIIDGAIEALTEKIGVDKTLNILTGESRRLIVNLGKQAFAEGGEEGLSYTLNYLADLISSDPNAKFDIKELAQQAAAGTLSGFGIGGVAHYATNGIQGGNGKTLPTPNVEQPLANDILPTSPQIPASETAFAPTATSEAMQNKTPQSAVQAETEADKIIRTAMELQQDKTTAPAEQTSAERFVDELSRTISEAQGVKTEEGLSKLFNEDFYKQFEGEDKSEIKQTVSELEAIKASPEFEQMTFEEKYAVNQQLRALKAGFNNAYDYEVATAKNRATKDYQYETQSGNGGYYTDLIKKQNAQQVKTQQLEQDIAASTPHKNAQYNIIQASNPAFNDTAVWVRSPKDIQTFGEVVNDPESFTWGDFSREDAAAALKRGSVRVYSSYPIKNGTFVSTSYAQALDYAGGDPSKVHSRTVALDSVAWINGDEGQYAKVKENLSKFTKEGLTKELTEIYNNAVNTGGGHVNFGPTPEVFLKYTDAIDGPMAMRPDVAYLAMHKEGSLKGDYHDLGIKRLSELPDKMKDPESIFVSKNNGRLNSFVELNDNRGRPIMAVVEMDTIATLEGEKKRANQIISVFGAKPNYIINKLKNDWIKLYDKKTGYSSQSTPRGHLPSGINDDNPISDDSILNSSEKINSLEAFSSSEVSDGTGEIAKILPEDGNYETANNALYAVNPELMKVGNAVSSGWDKLYQRVVSGQAPIEKLGPDAAALVQLCRQAGGVVGTIAETGLVTPQGAYLAPSYVDVFVKAIPKDQRAAFNEYRQQLHNIDRMSLSLNADYDLAVDAYNEFVANNPEFETYNEAYLQKLAKSGDGNPAEQYIALRDAVELAKEAKDKPVVGHDDGTPFTAEESSEYVAAVEALHPEWVEIKDAQNKWWDAFNREWLVKPGIVTEAAYDELRAKYPNYMPTYRVDGKKGGAGIFGGRISANVIKEAKGSLKEVLPLEQQFIEQINRVIQIERRNELGQYLFNYAAMNATDAAKQGIAIAKDADKTVEAALGEGYVDSQETETLKQLPGGKYQFNVKLENGKTGQLTISKEVYQAVDWIRNGGMGDAISPIVKALSQISAPIKAGITGYNPLFIVGNFFRDMQTYLINNSADNLLKAYSYYGKAAVEVARKGEHYKALKALGGLNSGYYKLDEAYKPKKEYGTVGKVLTAIPKGIGIGSQYVESLPRMAEYLALVDKYGNTPEGRRRAALGAADVTVNFSKSGPVSRALNSGVLYFNANIQGIDKTVRQLKAHPAKTLGRAAGTVLLASILLGLINKENPWYDDLDNRTKDSYFIIPNLLGEKDENGYSKTFFKVPRSREYGIVFGAVFDRTMRALETGDWKDAYKGIPGEIWSNFAPPDITTDNILSMFTRVGLFDNEDQGKTWYGGNIVPDSMADVSPENQHDINTSGIATNIGKVTGLSPKKIDNIIDSYGGYIGDLLQAGTSPKNAGENTPQTIANAIASMLVQPLEKRFTADPVYNSGVVDDFYALKDEATKTANDKNIAENIPATIRTPEEKALTFVNELSAQLSDLYKQEKAMYAEPGSYASKRDESRALREQMNELARGAEEQYQRIIEDEQKKWDELSGIVDVQTFYDEVVKAAAVEGDKSRLSRAEAIVMIDNHFDDLSPDKKALLFDLAGELTTNGAAWKNNPYR